MNSTHLSFAPNGKILQSFTAFGVAVERLVYTGTFMELPEPAAVTSQDHYVEGGMVLPRPRWTPPDPGPAPFTVDLSGLSTDAVIVVRNEAGDALTLMPGEPLTLLDAGRYEETITAGFPFVSATTTLRVSP